jgi:hypothetical protein
VTASQWPGQGPAPEGWEAYQQRKAEHLARIEAKAGEYQTNHPDELAIYLADERRAAKKSARLASGKLNEHEEQCLVVKWLRSRPYTLKLWATCNGVVFGMTRENACRYNAYLKAEGKDPGVPDLCIGPPPASSRMTALEMKSLTGTVSDAQKEWLDYLGSIGWLVLVAYGHEEAIELLEGAGY